MLISSLVGPGSSTPDDVNIPVNVGIMKVSKNITTPTAATLRIAGYTIAPFIFEFIS